MKELFLERAKENLKAAELLFEQELFNASANRAYYAAFHAAIVAIMTAGVQPIIDH
ncbi:MAG: HEPN domain-containing protein [Ignavibacteria bacterium]|nr:HEPN domain-containing protein [Ignavibacteria bacterium]